MKDNYFTILWWFLPYINMNQPLVFMWLPSWTSLPPPSPSHPSGLSALLQVSNLHWSSILHTVIYRFQCYSLKSYHPHLLSQSSKVCSLYQYFFCCLAYRVFVTIFLNSRYMYNILYWCFSFWLTSLCIIGSSFIHLIRIDSNVFFL